MGGLPGGLLLPRLVPVAVLLPAFVRGPGGPRIRPPGARLAGGLAGLVAFLPARVPGAFHPDFPGGVPGHLLLLPQGLLPVVLRDAAGMRRGPSSPGRVPRRDRSPDRTEPAPLRPLLRRGVHRHSLLRRLPCLLPRRPPRRG